MKIIVSCKLCLWWDSNKLCLCSLTGIWIQSIAVEGVVAVKVWRKRGLGSLLRWVISS